MTDLQYRLTEQSRVLGYDFTNTDYEQILDRYFKAIAHNYNQKNVYRSILKDYFEGNK